MIAPKREDSIGNPLTGELMGAIFEAIDDAIHVIDTEGRYVAVNSETARRLGLSKEEILGKTVWELYASHEWAQTVVESDLQVLTTGIPIEVEEQFPGRRVASVCHVRKAPLRDSDGRVTGVVAVSRDITERKRAVEKLARISRLYQLLGEADEAILRAPDREKMFEDICRIAVERGSFTAAWIGLIAQDTGSLQVTHQQGTPPEPSNLQRSSAVFPLWVGSKVIGALGVCEAECRALNTDEMRLLSELSTNISFGLASLEQEKTRQQVQEKLERSVDLLRRAMEGTVEAMAVATELRDPYTAGHQRAVSKLASAIAQEMGLSDDEIEGVRLAGLIHDVGKISIPAEILVRPGRLSEVEMAIIRTHTQAGHDILKGIEFPWPIAEMVLQHHERMNGIGYPRGLSGKDLLVGSRILGVADVVEAMASHRPYRPALGIEKALDEISQGKGTTYDPEVVAACLRLFRDKGFRWE